MTGPEETLGPGERPCASERQRRILALDTCSHAASAAVCAGDRLLGVIGLRTRRPSSALLPAIEALLRSLGLRAGDMDAFAVTAGPGSFTGLRVGLVAAQSLAHATGRSAVAIGTLDALAASGRHLAPPLCTMMDARRGRVYASIYALSSGWPVRTAPIEDADPRAYLSRLRWPVTLVGDGLDAYPEACSQAPAGSRRGTAGPFLAPAAAELARRALDSGEALAPAELRPLYVRAADARLPAGAPVPHDG